ncbi:MAG: putative bifunctional diguanylate cyclase/phosphodiesterase [Aquihabitans sp.]
MRGREPLSPEDRLGVAERQTQVAVRILAIANLANSASILLTGGFMIPHGPFRLGWTAAMLATISNSCRIWWPWVREPHRSTTPAMRRILMVDVMAGAVLYAVLAVEVIPVLNGAEQVVLTATLVGVIGSGAIALSTVRSVSLAWIAVTLSGLAAGFIADGAHVLIIELTQVALYAAALAAAIEYLAWSFEQRYRAERESERGREVVTMLLDDFEGGAREWLWRTDPSGLFLTPSARFIEASGREPAELEQRTMVDLIDEDGRGTGAVDIREAMATTTAFRDVSVPVTVDGEARWWLLSGTKRPDGSWSGVGADITINYEQDREIRWLARYDPLTGLANRRTFSETLDRLLSTRRADQTIVLSIIDLDNFKTVNDTLGHGIGDQLLAAVGKRLALAIEPASACARLGGDEFAVISTASVDGARSTPLDTRLEEVFDAPFVIEGTHLDVRGSIGQAVIPDDAATADELVQMADLALYAAKASGTGQIRRFEPMLRVAAEARALAQQDLRTAIAEHAFELRFQPLVSARGDVVAFEALARWHHAQRGWISPELFIGLAEETGLILPLGEQLLDGALAVAADLPTEVRIAVNVAPAQLVSTGFAAAFQAALDRHGVDAARIDVEVTESAVVDRDARQAIVDLRALGCGIAVDDFGTGYSSFASLQDLPLTQIKIDRAFISRLDVPESDRARAIVRAIVGVAAASDLSCVAEGVETVEQRNFVCELGCIVQGYLESRPMEASHIRAYLSQKHPGSARRFR